MKCITAEAGANTEGLRLAKDPPEKPDGQPRYFVHMQPDHYGQVNNVEALLATGCARMDGDDVIVLRCTVSGGDLLPEEKPDGKLLVLGCVDHRQAFFNGDPAEPQTYRTALGPDVWASRLLVSRHNNRVKGKTTGHEEFRFLAVFDEGDCIKSNIIFETEANTRLDLWADGVLFSCTGGVPQFHVVPVVRETERFACRTERN